MGVVLEHNSDEWEAVPSRLPFHNGSGLFRRKRLRALRFLLPRDAQRGCFLCSLCVIHMRRKSNSRSRKSRPRNPEAACTRIAGCHGHGGGQRGALQEQVSGAGAGLCGRKVRVRERPSCAVFALTICPCISLFFPSQLCCVEENRAVLQRRASAGSGRLRLVSLEGAGERPAPCWVTPTAYSQLSILCFLGKPGWKVHVLPLWDQVERDRCRDGSSAAQP